MTLLLDVFLPVLVVLIMTIVGMDLRFTDFLRVRRYPLLVPATIVSQWVAAILVAVLVGRLLELPQAVAGGVLLLLVGMSIRHCAAAWTLRFRSQLQLLAALACK